MCGCACDVTIDSSLVLVEAFGQICPKTMRRHAFGPTSELVRAPTQKTIRFSGSSRMFCLLLFYAGMMLLIIAMHRSAQALQRWLEQI